MQTINNLTFRPFDWLEYDKITPEGHLSREIAICCESKEDNVSCCVKIENFPIRILCELPNDLEYTASDLDLLKIKIANLVTKLDRRTTIRLQDCIYGNVTIIEANGFQGYLDEPMKYIELYFKANEYINSFKQKLEDNSNFYIHGNLISLRICEFEKEFDSTRKFTIQTGLNYSQWFSCDCIVVENKTTSFKREYVAEIASFKLITSPESLSWVSRPTNCAFDIETQSYNGTSHPDALYPKCPISCISMCIQKVEKLKIQLVTSNFIPSLGDTVYYLKSEKELILKFFELVVEHDVDIFSGHNILGYDWRYIYLRMRYNHIDFNVGSRFNNLNVSYKDESWGSTNTSKVDVKYIDMPGRIHLDTYHITRSIISKRLPNYKLETICKEYLGRGKHDVTPKEMFKAFDDYKASSKKISKLIAGYIDNKPIKHINVSEALWQKTLSEYIDACERSKKVSEYCLEDSALILDLFEVLNILPIAREYSNVIQVRMKHVYTKGQQFKGLSQLYALLRENNVVFNTVDFERTEYSYEGALNLGTMLGKKVKQQFAVSGDVGSMYPSIIEDDNICITTDVSMKTINKKGWIENRDYKKHRWEDYKGTASEISYDVNIVNSSIHVGFIPRIVKIIKERRTEAKAVLATLKPGSALYVVVNAKQEGLKVVNNSLYGLLGSSNNRLFSAKHLGALVTYRGRCLLLKIKDFVEHGGDPTKPSKFAKADTIYGDTDSIQFYFLPEEVIKHLGKPFSNYKELLDYAYIVIKALCEYIKPIKIILEKAGTLLLMGPKRYVFHLVDHEKYLDIGCTIVNPKYGDWKKMSYTGVEFVKRNQTPLLKKLYKYIIELSMDESYELDLEPKARELSRLQHIFNAIISTVFNMYNSKYSLEDYYIYEAYNKESSTTAMSKLVNRMALKGRPILLGERIAYIIVDSPNFKKDISIGLRMRLPEDISYPETIYQEHYVEKISTAIDPVLYSLYSNNPIFDEFIVTKGLYNVLMNVCNLRIHQNINLTDYHYNLIINNVKNEYRQYLKASYREMKLYSSSERYKIEVPKAAKSNITNAINKVNKEGYGLITSNTALVENLILAHKLGVLLDYKNCITTANIIV